MRRGFATIVGAAALLAWIFFGLRGGEEPLAPSLSSSVDGGRARQETADETKANISRAISNETSHGFLYGIVESAEGEPITGASVASLAYPSGRASLANRPPLEAAIAGVHTRSDENGRFRIPLDAHDALYVKVEAEGFAPALISDGVAGARLRIVLVASARLEILVRDEEGQPVADVLVKFWRNDIRSTSYEPEGRTDTSGVCVFERIAPGPGKVMLKHAELGSAWEDGVEIAAQTTTRREVVLRRGKVVRGRVVDAANDTPIAGARIEWGRSLEQVVRSDETGRYTLPGWPSVYGYDLCIHAEGFCRETVMVRAYREIVDVALERGDRARGRVISERGDAIGGAVVTAYGYGDERSESRSATTRLDGSFELGDLRRDLVHQILVRAAGHGQEILELIRHPDVPGIVELGDIRLTAGCTIEGVVRWEDGTPLPGESVSCWRSVQPMQGLPSQDRVDGRTDAGGRFRIFDLAPGEYQVSALPSGMPRSNQPCALEEGGAVQDLEFVYMNGKSLSVRIVENGGTPAHRVFVQVRGDDVSAHASTNLEGVASFRGLPTTKLSVETAASKHYLASEKIMVWPADAEVVVSVTPAAPIRGVVQDMKGNPVPDLGIAAVDREGRNIRGYAAPDGSFEISTARGVPVSLKALGTRPQGGRTPNHPSALETPYEGELHDVSSPALDVVLRVSKPIEDRLLEVLVLDPDGQAVSGALVLIPDARPSRRAKTDAGGIARFEELPRQALRVRAMSPTSGKGWTPSPLVSARPEGQRITLTLGKVNRISGTVLLPNGSPANGARLEIRSGERVLRTRHETNADGTFEVQLPELPTYTILATLALPSGQELTGRLESVVPNSRQLVIRLAP